MAPLSNKDKMDIIKGSLTGEVDKPAFEAIQEAEQMMAEEEVLQEQSQETIQQPVQQPEVASTGGPAAGPQIPHPNTGPTQPHLVNSASSMEIGLNQASGTSRGATTLGTDGTYRKGGPKFNDPPPFEFSACSTGEWNGGDIKTACGNRDSAHNLYGNFGMTVGKDGNAASGSGRLGLGYSTHVPYSPITGHIGLSGGGRVKMDNEGDFIPIFDATASLGLEGEMGGNSYNWREPWTYGGGLYGKRDLIGGTGTTIGAYGHIGQFSGKIGYNKNTGPEATIGLGLPIREKGGFKEPFAWEPPKLKKSMSFDEMLRRQRFQESSFRHDAVSPKGATGVAQIMPDTLDYAKKKGWVPKSTTMEDVKKFDIAEKIQINYMNNLLDRDWNKGSEKVRRAKALIAYNWGPKNTVRKLNELKKKGIDIYADDLTWISHFNEESKNYVGRILLNEGDFQEQYNQGIKDNIPLKMRSGGCDNSKMLYNKAKRKK